MFYLIDEKDGLKKEQGSILVNANLLKTLDSCMSRNGNEINVRFYFFKGDNECFSFNNENCFNVNLVMEKLSQLKVENYSNALMIFKDFENIKALQNKQFYLHKFSNILVNLNSIALVHKYEKGGSIVVTQEKNILIQENPEEVFSMINSRILT